jgi:N-acetylmuramoyl-L-alanine amidase
MNGLPIASAVFATETSDEEQNSFVIVLDAGHGGEDCGAVGINGVYEKDLNMKITEQLASYLRLAGYHVVLTRTDDRLLYDPETVVKGHKKTDDLANRMAIANSYENAVFVSIHMNSFPSQSVHGLQVWYSNGRAESKRLADLIQTKTATYLQADNTRKPKESNGAMYLLDYAENPTVLVECGFLTNFAECENLSDEVYQKQLSFVLFCAMMEYIDQSM